MENDNAVSLCLVVTVIFSFYLLIHYSFIYLKTIQLYKYQGDNYRKNYLEKLLVTAVFVVASNANTIAHPYFYNQSIDYILNTTPNYIHVFKFCSYILQYSQSQIDLNDILIERYGVNYTESPQLNIRVRVQTSEYGVDEYLRYVLEDFEKCTVLYLRNRQYVDNMLKYIS